MSEKESKYVYSKKSAWELLTKDQIQQAFASAEEYKQFLARVKTERETVHVFGL